MISWHVDKVFIKMADRPGAVAQEEQAKQLVVQNPGIMLNTFDMINDKILNKIPLNDSEQKFHRLGFRLSSISTDFSDFLPLLVYFRSDGQIDHVTN